MTSRAELLLSIAGRTDAYGEEQPDVTMKVVYEPLTRKVLGDHLVGRRNIGVFLISPEEQAKAGGFAMWERSRRARLALIKLKGLVRKASLSLLTEDMADEAEGYRGWVLLPRPTPAWLVARFLRECAEAVEEPGLPVETAPTEEEVRRLGFLTMDGILRRGLPLFLDEEEHRQALAREAQQKERDRHAT